MMSIVRIVVLLLLTTAISLSEATVCDGPNLSSITVKSARTLEVASYDEVARSTDGGKTWVVTKKKERTTNVSWDRSYKDNKGKVYRNSVVNHRPTVQRSSNGGKTWRTVDFVAPKEESLVVGVHGETVYFFAGENLALNDYPPMGSVKRGSLYVTDGSKRRKNVSYKAGEIEVSRFTALKKYVLNSHLSGSDTAVTGFDIGASGELYISTPNYIFVSTTSGETWDSIDHPKGWVACNGDPPGR